MEETLLALAVLLIAAKLMEGVALRLKQSPLAAYVLTGIVLGPALGLVHPSAELSLFFSLGVIFLFFLVGVDEIDISGFAATLRGRFTLAALIALLVPLLSGIAVLRYLLEFPTGAAIGLAGVLALSSLGVVAKILGDQGHLKEPLGLEIFTTVVMVELVGLLVVGFTLQGQGENDEFSFWKIGILLGQIIGFAVVAWLLASRLFSPMMVRLRRWLGGPQLAFGVLLGTLLLTVVAAEYIGLHGSLGALLLGTALSGLPSRLRAEVMPGMRSIANGLFVPLFFSAVGLQLSLSFLSLPPFTVGAIVLVAVVAKPAGAVLGPLASRLDKPFAIASGLMAKGVVEIALLLVMLEVGAITQEVFSLVTVIMLAYIFVMPPIISFAISRDKSEGMGRLPATMLPSYARYALDTAVVQDIVEEGRQFAKSDTSVGDFLEQWAVPGQQDYVIIGEDRKLVGILSLPRLTRIPKERWPSLTVGSLAHRQCAPVYPDTSLDDVLERMAENMLTIVPVVDRQSGEFVGAVSSRDVMTLVVQADEAAAEH